MNRSIIKPFTRQMNRWNELASFYCFLLLSTDFFTSSLDVASRHIAVGDINVKLDKVLDQRIPNLHHMVLVGMLSVLG